MKLFELATANPSKQAAKVFESYFGDKINVDVISGRQAHFMLNKVRRLIIEHRQTPAFHVSEQNPTYLKLMMMEKVLAAKVKETSTVPVGAAAGAQQNVQNQQANMAQPNPTVATGQAAEKAKRLAQINNISDPQLKVAMQKATQGQQLSQQDQQMVANAALQTESRQLRHQLYRVLRESEVQQAQVVLAAQDMVDEIQKVIEQITSMQFKDLPALVDQIENQLGIEQAGQFNTGATAALGNLVQNLQATKQQMDQAKGILTGQAAPAIPGLGGTGAQPNMGGGMGMGDEMSMGGEEMPPEEMPEPETGSPELGRAKR
jgi:hypothetical protein